MSPPIRLLASGYGVAQAVHEIESQPEVWNTHRLRTERYGTPHAAVSDIWVRYNDWAHFDGDAETFNAPHESVWYPVVEKIPAVRVLVERVFSDMAGETLGGVLITKIPSGGQVAPHIDGGWHAGHYRKFAVQLRGNDRQAFCFEDARLSAQPGDLYTFDNSQLHWVVNESDEDRITLIICLR